MEHSWGKAKERGETRYFTGKPCKAGHIAERLTSTRNCVACHNERAVAYHAKKKSDSSYQERRHQSTDAWRKAHPERQSVYNARWRAAHPEKVCENNRRWRAKYPEKAKANGDRWRANNRAKARKAVKDWEERNPERATLLRRTIKINRRAREAENGGVCTPEELVTIRRRHRGRCAECRRKSASLEIDHIIPLARGGTSDATNLQLLCRSCNARKSDRDPIEWARSNDRLV